MWKKNNTTYIHACQHILTSPDDDLWDAPAGPQHPLPPAVSRHSAPVQEGKCLLPSSKLSITFMAPNETQRSRGWKDNRQKSTKRPICYSGEVWWDAFWKNKKINKPATCRQDEGTLPELGIEGKGSIFPEEKWTRYRRWPRNRPCFVCASSSGHPWHAACTAVCLTDSASSPQRSVTLNLFRNE